jgi:hypothetical protein
LGWVHMEIFPKMILVQGLLESCLLHLLLLCFEGNCFGIMQGYFKLR